MRAALPATLTDGAGGDSRRRAVAELAQRLGLGAGVSARELAHLQVADAYTRADAPAEADNARTRAATLDNPPLTPSPTGTATPAAPQSRTADYAQPSPPPPDAPDTAAR